MVKREKTFLYITITSLSVVSLVFALSSKNIKTSVLTKGDTSFNLSMDNSQKITLNDSFSGTEITNNVRTRLDNQISLAGYNIVNNATGWQTLLPGGYFYNPINSSTHKNKISGISAIKFETEDNKNLSLSYGYTLDDESIVYSKEKVLSPNVYYDLSNLNPTYFYIKNNNNTNVNISKVSVQYSCIEGTYPKQNLKILMIGNSFADDTIFYAQRVAESYGINLDIYNSYIASCTIDMHYDNLLNDTASYSMRTMNGSNWSYQNNMTLDSIIDSNTWDIITFQQASSAVGRSSSYSNLSNLVSEVRTRVGPNPKFYWHQTWAYDHDYADSNDNFSYFNNDQLTMYNDTNTCYTNQVESLHVFEGMIPAGTAVQNLRTSYMKDTFTRDGKHMSSVHGRYLLALNFISTIFDIDLDKSECSYLPSEINSEFKTVAYESIRNASKTPLNCTNSLYPTKSLAPYNLSNYTEIDAELVGCSYWDSTDSNNYNKRISNVKDSSNLYVSTKQFTSSTLPVGSLVVLDEAFGYLPEAWTSNSVQASRKAKEYNNVLEITFQFWSGYSYRAFNIFKAGETELKGQYDQIFDSFHIYVPNSSMGSLTPKATNTFYNSDKTVFTNNYTNIDAYERLHLDPITGFYKCDSYYDLTNSYVDDTAKKFVCTRPFYSTDDDLPENTVIILDSGYQWRSDCWGDHGTYSPRPGNNASSFLRLNSSFWSNFRRRTFNVSSTSSSYVGQNYISFLNHMRIYVPVSDDIDIERNDTVTMTALGYASMTSTFASFYGKSEIPFLITLHGDDVNRVKVEVDSNDAGATNYTFNKETGALSINTTGKASGYSYGTISGTVNRDAGTITNISISGDLNMFMTNNGSVVCSEIWHDRCNYSTNAASQNVWQRWYMSGSWTANSGTGEWTTADPSHLLDNDYSMGLRIANNTYTKTRFTLKNDFNSGAGITPHGISIWLYNPNGNIYGLFRIYVYTTASTYSGGHAVPGTNAQIYETSDGIGNNEWKNIKLGFSKGTIYNMSLYFECSSSATTYVSLGHVSFY